MNKAEVETLIRALVPSAGWPGSPNNLKLQDALLAMNSSTSVKTEPATDATYDVPSDVSVVFADATSNAVDVTLGAAADNEGSVVSVLVTNVDNAVQVVPAENGELVGGNYTNLNAVGDSATFVCNGTSWFVLNENIAN